MQSISREEVADLAWLAGILDGEGSMHLAKSNPNNRFYVQISVTNTNPYMIQRVSEIWSRMNVKFSFNLQKRPPRREYMAIVTTGLGSARKVLEAVLPYLTAKRSQAETLLSFITWRQAQGYHVSIVGKEGYVAMGEKVREELHNLRYQDFNLQRLSRTASKTLQVG